MAEPDNPRSRNRLTAPETSGAVRRYGAQGGQPVARNAFADLLSGPRGRRLCNSVLPISGLIDESALLVLLADTVSAARYWQEADEQDVVLADPTTCTALRPTADALARSAAAAWWSSPMDVTRQRYVQWLDENPADPPSLVGASDRLANWRAATVEDEQGSARRPPNLSAPFSGQWWSAPAHTGLTVTSRSLPGLGAARLALVEESLGWKRADVWSLTPASGCRVYEISGREAWTELVERYPMEVTASKRHDWWRTTGVDSAWFIPDWTRVADDFDAVHLTVTGYLTAAGHALLTSHGHTVLTGWSPDETYWLADVLTLDGPPVEWRRLGDQEFEWTANDH